MINGNDLNLFENFYEEEQELNTNTHNNSSEAQLGKKRIRQSSNLNENNPSETINQVSNLDSDVKEDQNDDVSDNDNHIKINKKDFTIEEKLRRLLDGDTDSYNECDEFKVTSYNFNGMIHDIITPKNYEKEFNNFVNSPRAKKYEFKLDAFQERAILSLENGQSVLVSAHTSAGKTVVAQYAIAMALRDKQRVIYTSPIKALSNQKFRELQHEFKDVGLMTGDVTINSGASCIVMTTEILRNMLYKGSEITREMAWVIFDEIHYMRDKERGVVWEETIILLPNTVKYVFLSATIPNASEFAKWICRIKNQPCNVIFTMFRPVPLQHYVYVSGSEGIYLVVDEKGNFKSENYNKAISVISEELCLDKIFDKKSKKKQGVESDIKKIITLIKDKNLDPAIIFAFSKKDCEVNAMSLMKMDLTTDDEKEMIEKIYKNAISTLSEEDQQLPQIQMILPLIKKGIGIHHGGLLPIVKESIELIFQEGFLKALFSTETFSMGINMPARTVVFTNIEKYDGEDYRWITGSEYIQMSGRAGRRGIDDKGITILMMNKKLDTDVAKSMLKGASDPLYSSFHLSKLSNNKDYNMIVNMLRAEGVNPEYIIKRSFHQFQSERAYPEYKSKLKVLREKLNNIQLVNEEGIKEILTIQSQLSKYNDEITKIINQPENLVPFLIPGRLIKIKGFGWGICVNVLKKNFEIEIKKMKNKKEAQNIINSLNGSVSQVEMYFIDVLLYVKNHIDNDSKLLPGSIEKGDGQMGVVPVIINTIENISQIKVNIPRDLKDKKELKKAETFYSEVIRRFPEIPLMDPIKDMEISNEKLEDSIEKVKNLKSTLKKMKCYTNDDIEKFKEKEEIRNNINILIDSMSKCKEIVLKDDLRNMKRVLRRLQFVNDETVLAKGQVACILTSSDEILLTEMLFSGAFNDIEPKLLCAMLSCFMMNENSSKDDTKMPKNPFLLSMFNKIKEAAGKVADVLIECRININKNDYMSSFKCDLMDVVLEWAEGSKFSDICKLTDIYEGTIIRIIRRLDELIRQLSEACQVINNTSLKDKLEKASSLIKRGIIFAASLYLNA